MASMQDPNPQPTPEQPVTVQPPETVVLPAPAPLSTHPSVEITQPPAPAPLSTHRSVEITQPPTPAPLSTHPPVGITQPPAPAPQSTHPSVATEDVLLHRNTSTLIQSDNQTSYQVAGMSQYISEFCQMHIL
jgi:hypothetical protein